MRKDNMVLSGAAGCGKTFIVLHQALSESKDSQYRKKVIIVRSVVPTRDMGFLPGSQKEKEAAYTTPYENVVNELYADGKAWEMLTERDVIRFMTTSYIRGITLRNSIVIVDAAKLQFTNGIQLSVPVKVANHLCWRLLPVWLRS